MVGVGQGVDHGDGAVAGQVDQLVVAEGAHDQAIGVARQHACGVADGLIAAELGIVLGHEDGPAAEVAHGDLEGHPGAGGGFFENENAGLAGQQIAAVVGGLHGGGPVEDAGGLVAAEIEDGQKMSGHCDILPERLPRIGKKEVVTLQPRRL